jgi:BirA family biotin operon repressor/biotin-[acetyl-CoA-carboxylase] ligase
MLPVRTVARQGSRYNRAVPPDAAPSPAVDPRLLELLLAAASPTPLDAVAARLSLPVREVARRIESLRAAGCVFDAHPQQGVRLVNSGLEVWSDFLEPRHAGQIGRKVTVYRQTTSTQDVARQLSGGSAEHDGHVVVADHQTAGRGRLGRRWFGFPAGALLFTVVVRRKNLTVDRLMLGSCCAAAQAVEQFTGLSVQIRWPNDLLIAGRKLAGILVEAAGEVALIGIGLNVSVTADQLPSHDASRAVVGTSLADHGFTLDRLRLLDEMLTQLERTIHHADDAALHDAWQRRSSLTQQRVTVQTGDRRLTGRVIDIDVREGLLLAAEPGGLVTLPAATTSLVFD